MATQTAARKPREYPTEWAWYDDDELETGVADAVDQDDTSSEELVQEGSRGKA